MMSPRPLAHISQYNSFSEGRTGALVNMHQLDRVAGLLPANTLARFPAVLFVVGCDGDTVRYRCHHPLEQLSRQGVHTQIRHWVDPRLFSDLLAYDIFILHRVMFTGFIPDWLDLAKQFGKVTIFDTDDLVFDPSLLRHSNHRAARGVVDGRRFRRSFELHRQTLDRCDYALVTTDFLADELRRRGKRTIVSRNALNDEQILLSDEAYRNRSTNSDRVIIAYFSGSPSHDRDFAVAAPALLHLMEHYPQVHLHVFGYLSPGRRFARFGERIHRTPYMNWRDLPRAIGQVDINIAPLELGNPFCESKSELKYFEAGAVGVPTVASPTDAFRFAIKHGENGLLAHTAQEWISHLESLIVNAERRRQIGEAARRHVATDYTTSARSPHLAEALLELWRGARESCPPRRVIDQMLHYLSTLIVFDDLSRVEKDIIHLAHDASRRQRHAGYSAWVRAKSWIKDRLHVTYRHEFFNQPCVLSPELITGQRFGGRFTATQPNLYRLDIPFATHARSNTPDIVLHLQTTLNDVDDLATLQVPGALLRDNQPYRFIFDPISNSQGREFYFWLESPHASSGNAFSLWLLPNRDQPVVMPRYLVGDQPSW